MAKGNSPENSNVVEQELGTLEVADRVFLDLVRRAVAEAPGVVVAGRGSPGLFRRGGGGEAVLVERGPGEVAFSVSLSVRYHTRIPAVVNELRQQIKSAVEESTGYRVRAVNVTVEHILAPEPETPAEPEPQGPSVPEPPPIPDQE